MLTHRNILANLEQTGVWISGSFREGAEIVIAPLPMHHIFCLTSTLSFLKWGSLVLLIANPLESPWNGATGLPFPSTEASIRDDSFTELPPWAGVGDVEKHTGEICIRGPQVMKGYWMNPGETAKVMQDGWLKTGEAVKVVIVKKDPDLARESVVEHCKAQLTGYKVPRHVEFRDSLPKSPIGKVLRRELRAPRSRSGRSRVLNRVPVRDLGVGTGYRASGSRFAMCSWRQGVDSVSMPIVSPPLSAVELRVPPAPRRALPPRRTPGLAALRVRAQHAIDGAPCRRGRQSEFAAAETRFRLVPRAFVGSDGVAA